MGLPPKDVPATDLWRKLLAAPAPSEIVDFPRRDIQGISLGKIRVMVLDSADQEWASEEGMRRLEKKGFQQKDALPGTAARELLGDQAARCLLARAIRTVEPIPDSELSPQGVQYGFVFPTPEHLNVLTADEMNVLFTAYLMVQDKYGPTTRNIESEAELNTWLQRLAEGASALPLSRLNWRALAELSFALALRAYGVSALLEFLCSSSPSILESIPAGWNFGTGFYGAQHANRIANGLIPGVEEQPASPSSSAPSDDVQLPDDEPVTIEDAARVAKSLGHNEYAGGEEPDLDT